MYSLALALQDFVPVILGAIGIVAIVRLVRREDPAAGQWALLGAVLIVGGGLSRATWKLLNALTGADVVPLFLALYVLLATGYLLFAMALWHGWQTARDRHARVAPWVPALAALVLLLPATALLAPQGGRILPLLWLFTATAGSLVTSLILTRWARGIGERRLAALFLANLVATLVLNGVARSDNQGEAVQWIAQLLNTVNQGAFMLAAVGLERAARGVRARDPGSLVEDALGADPRPEPVRHD
ncbi:MAG TPA: hypothetical protein VFY23_08185 [Candidatus Limnocylindrales bacterium]|nr:hypothetical protein [Candidatus Limnocylindrales bacterium]